MPRKRAAFTSLPPDAERGLDWKVPAGAPFDLGRVRNGQTVALETGGTWSFESSPNLAGRRGVSITAYGDRNKPWPLVSARRGVFTLKDCRDCTVEYLEAAGFPDNCWQAFDSTNISFRYLLGRDSGRVRGSLPSSGNRGHAFSVRGRKTRNVTLTACEAFGMAADGIQSNPDATRAHVEMNGCYFHDNIEDAVDIKAGNFRITDCWLMNNGSKALVMHGNAGTVHATRTLFSGSRLNDGVYIDGARKRMRLHRLEGSMVFEDCVMENNAKWGLVIKRTSADVVLRRTRLSLNGSGGWNSGVGHTGQVYVE